ncbi:nucleotidyltransferase family protein [Hydrogenimonas sp.]
MRLSEHDRAAIKEAFEEIFGEGEVVLFGSRVDDEARGGDIDLFLRPEKRPKKPVLAKAAFLSALYQRIGEQKIDIVFPETASPYLMEEIRKHGRRL